VGCVLNYIQKDIINSRACKTGGIGSSMEREGSLLRGAVAEGKERKGTEKRVRVRKVRAHAHRALPVSVQLLPRLVQSFP